MGQSPGGAGPQPGSPANRRERAGACRSRWASVDPVPARAARGSLGRVLLAADPVPIRQSRVPARGRYTLPLDSPFERELMSGGNMAGEVVRVGRTVHRRPGPWPLVVHAL